MHDSIVSNAEADAPEPIEDSEAESITGGGCNPNELCDSCGDSLFVCLMNGNCSE